MSEGLTIAGIIGGIIAFIGMVMAFARTSPDDAKTNLARWMEAIGFHRIPKWLGSFDFEKWASRAGVIITVITAYVLQAAYPDFSNELRKRIARLVRQPVEEQPRAVASPAIP